MDFSARTLRWFLCIGAVRAGEIVCLYMTRTERELCLDWPIWDAAWAFEPKTAATQAARTDPTTAPDPQSNPFRRFGQPVTSSPSQRECLLWAARWSAYTLTCWWTCPCTGISRWLQCNCVESYFWRVRIGPIRISNKWGTPARFEPEPQLPSCRLRPSLGIIFWSRKGSFF